MEDPSRTEANIMQRKSLVTSSQRQYLRDKVFYLSAACPAGHGNPCACPLYAVRNMGVMEKHKWHRQLSDLRLLSILAHHQKCLLGKAGSKKQGQS